MSTLTLPAAMPGRFSNTRTGLMPFRSSAISSRTPFPTVEVDPVILYVVFEWDGIEHSVSNLLEKTTPLDYPQSVVQAVAYIQAALGVSQSDVLKAVGIPPRTFFGWKKMLRHPRQNSLGVLWPMVKAISGLVQVHPNLEEWFNTVEGAREKFLAGDVNGLVLLELDYRFAVRKTVKPFTPASDDYEFDADEYAAFQPITPFREQDHPQIHHEG